VASPSATSQFAEKSVKWIGQPYGVCCRATTASFEYAKSIATAIISSAMLVIQNEASALVFQMSIVASDEVCHSALLCSRKSIFE